MNVVEVNISRTVSILLNMIVDDIVIVDFITIDQIRSFIEKKVSIKIGNSFDNHMLMLMFMNIIKIFIITNYFYKITIKYRHNLTNF